MRKSVYFIAIFLSGVLLSCNTCNNEKNKFTKVEIPKEDTLTVKINRYEKDLFGVSLKTLGKDLKALQPKYRFFLDGNLDDPSNLAQIKSYLTDPLILNLYEDCLKKYPDVNDLDAAFTKAFRYFKLYYPEKKIPKIYTYVSGMDSEMPVKYADSVLIVALDMYLGSSYKNYKMLGLPVYRQYRFRKESILPDCMKESAYTLIDNSKESKNFLDYILYEGKVLYFLDATLPDIPDSLKINYTSKQMEWCKANESNVWSFIINKKILYSQETTLIMKLLADGPFTAVFSKQSPPKVGVWIGWQIIRSYMNENKSITLKELFQDQNSKNILNKSRYKPKKE